MGAASQGLLALRERSRDSANGRQRDAKRKSYSTYDEHWQKCWRPFAEITLQGRCWKAAVRCCSLLVYIERLCQLHGLARRLSRRPSSDRRERSHSVHRPCLNRFRKGRTCPTS